MEIIKRFTISIVVNHSGTRISLRRVGVEMQ